MRIVYCLNNIYIWGGIEKVTIVKANFFAEIPGNEVYIVTMGKRGNDSVAQISPKVKLICLNVNYYENERNWHSKIQFFLDFMAKKRLHKNLLTKVLNEIEPDIVISSGGLEKFFLPSIKGNWKLVREMHSCSNHRQFEAYNIKEKLIARITDLYEYHYAIWKYDKTVLLTEEDKRINWSNWSNDSHLEVIFNPQTFTSNEIALLDAKRVIAIGRLVEQKNFASLIRAFRLVVDHHPDWSLDIYGSGPQKVQLQSQIDEMGLESNVFLKGNTSQVREKMLETSCYVMSSLCEGFGLVLVEAMTCGLPVISYACPCGPKDIVTEGKDGFLVPVGDERALADRICRIIEDEKLRKSMGLAAKEASEKYKLENVMQMWLDLFHRLLDDKAKK